jgi:endonuclease G
MNFTTKAILATLFALSTASAININQFINDNECNQTVDKEFFAICYDYDYKAAKAVGYTLDGDLVNENNIDKRPSFKVERAVPSTYRASTKDYTKSGYDRGHLACDAAFDWSQESLNATYSLANIIPQARKVNRYTWSKAERYARYVAVQLGSVNVINVVRYSKTPATIGKHHIAVPDGFYKVLYNKDQNFTRCLYYANDNNIDTSEDKLKDHVVDCTEVGDALKKRTCGSFDTWEAAQEWFEDRNPGWKRLDGNHDGIACQSLR